ncbi:MAG: urea carboxylase-associated family protein, partial [Candidatus Hadarchaeum sp.]
MSESPRTVETAIYDLVLPPGEGWIYRIPKGHVLRIVDLEGNQAVDTLFFDAANPQDGYSAWDTVREQGNVYLVEGSRLLSKTGAHLLTIIHDTCGRHDTIGGACSAESNSVRYPLERRYMHNCRDTFLKMIL